jgi:hypothetical protein
MRFWYQNLIDPSNIVITSSSASAGYPAPNVANELKAKVWRTGTTLTDEFVKFDFGVATSLSSAIIFAHTILNSDITIGIVASPTDLGGSYVSIAAVPYSSGPMAVVFSPVAYRYWAVTFTKVSAAVTRDIGRVFLGNYYDTTVQPDYQGFNAVPTDLSIQHRSVGGQLYTDKRPQYRAMDLLMSGVNDAMNTSMRTIFETVGRATSLFTQIDPTGSNEVNEVLYVKFSNPIERDANGLDWDLKFSLEEQL